MRRILALSVTLAAAATLPSPAQDARSEPTYEEMIQRSAAKMDCDAVDVDILDVARKRWPPVAEVLEELVHAPTSSPLRVKLGNEFGRLTLWDVAERAYRCAIQHDKGNAQAWNNLGLVLLAKREVGPSVKAFERAIDIDLNYARAHYHLGMAHDAANNYDLALRSYERAVSLDPRLGLARFNPQVASNPHRLELFMRRLLSEQAVRYELGEPDEH